MWCFSVVLYLLLSIWLVLVWLTFPELVVMLLVGYALVRVLRVDSAPDPYRKQLREVRRRVGW